MPDTLTPTQRSYCMSKVKNRGTDLERLVCFGLRKCGVRFRTHVTALPGTPDIVFSRAKVAVFVDGDFWHGYRFLRWKDDVAPFWREKILINKKRDFRNFKKIRGMGWKVVRIWQHELERDPSSCIQKILETVGRFSSD